MRTTWKSIFFGLLLSPISLAQDAPLQIAKNAIAEVHQMTSEAPKGGPGAMAGVLKKIDKVIDGVDQEPLYQSQQGVELLVELSAIKAQSLRHQRKIADGRRMLQSVELKLEKAKLPTSTLAIAQSRILVLTQDLSFEDQNWKDLDRNADRLKSGFDKMGDDIDALRQQGAVVVQMIRYCDAAKKSLDAERLAKDSIVRIQQSEVLSDTERMVLVGRIVDQLLDFRSRDPNWKGADEWLQLADQAWKRLRDEKETSSRILAAQLIAHRAELIPNKAASQSCWREFEEWLSRDSFAFMCDPYIGREYIEANVSYLHRIEPAQFAVHLIRTYQFLDEFQEKLEALSKSKSSPGLLSAELAKLMRSQLDQRIAIRKTAINRPALKQVGPPIEFQFIHNSVAGSLSQYHGKVVVLEFWNPHCGACLSSFEWLSDYHRKHRDRGMTVLGCTYSADEYLSEQGQELTREQSLNKFREFLTKYKVDYPVVLANDPNVLHAYGVLAEPTLVVLDRQGKVLFYSVGIQEFQSDACQSTIMKALER